MGVNMPACTRQILNIVHRIYNKVYVINFNATRTSFFSYLEIDLLSRTRYTLNDFLSARISFHFHTVCMWLCYVHVQNPILDFEFY